MEACLGMKSGPPCWGTHHEPLHGPWCTPRHVKGFCGEPPSWTSAPCTPCMAPRAVVHYMACEVCHGGAFESFSGLLKWGWVSPFRVLKPLCDVYWLPCLPKSVPRPFITPHTFHNTWSLNHSEKKSLQSSFKLKSKDLQGTLKFKLDSLSNLQFKLKYGGFIYGPLSTTEPKPYSSK